MLGVVPHASGSRFTCTAGALVTLVATALAARLSSLARPCAASSCTDPPAPRLRSPSRS